MFWFIPVILWSAAAGALTGAATALLIDFFIDESSIADSVSHKYENAFKVLIKDKKTRTVDVGIFDETNAFIDDMTIESDKGVSASLRIGQEIYI